jgi:hypothetical protein
MNIKKSIFVYLMLMSTWVFADINCPSQVIEHVRIQEGNAFYKQRDAYWRKLGDLESFGTQASYAFMLTAKANRDLVQTSYPDGYDCGVANLSTSISNTKTVDYISVNPISFTGTYGKEYESMELPYNYKVKTKFIFKLCSGRSDYDSYTISTGGYAKLPSGTHEFAESGYVKIDTGFTSGEFSIMGGGNSNLWFEGGEINNYQNAASPVEFEMEVLATMSLDEPEFVDPRTTNFGLAMTLEVRCEGD